MTNDVDADIKKRLEQDIPHDSEANLSDFDRFLKNASKIVESWPEWKKKALREALSSRR
jgi:hypothetical protein